MPLPDDLIHLTQCRSGPPCSSDEADELALNSSDVFDHRQFVTGCVPDAMIGVLELMKYDKEHNAGVPFCSGCARRNL